MQPLQYSISIQAPCVLVHHTMLNDETYRVWTSEFATGSYYRGSWEPGAQILFLNPEGFGMRARIAEHRPAEFVSVQMLSEVREGSSQAQEPWPDAFESYSFSEADGVTTIRVDIRGVPADWVPYLNSTWPKALAKLKDICESSGAYRSGPRQKPVTIGTTSTS